MSHLRDTISRMAIAARRAPGQVLEVVGPDAVRFPFQSVRRPGDRIPRWITRQGMASTAGRDRWGSPPAVTRTLQDQMLVGKRGVPRLLPRLAVHRLPDDVDDAAVRPGAAGGHLVREVGSVVHRHAPVRARVQPGDRPAVGDPVGFRRVPHDRPCVRPDGREIVRGAMDVLGGDPERTDLVPFAEPGACRLRLLTRG